MPYIESLENVCHLFGYAWFYLRLKGVNPEFEVIQAIVGEMLHSPIVFEVAGCFTVNSVVIFIKKPIGK